MEASPPLSSSLPPPSATDSTSPHHNIVYLDRSAVRAVIRRPAFPHTWTEFPSSDPSQILPRLHSATICITSRTHITDAHLAHLPHLRLIAVAATGYDCVDVPACRCRGVAVTNIRGWCATSLPQHVFALILALRRQLLLYRQRVEEGAWTLHCHVEPTLPLDLSGATLAIIGAGVLGTRIADIGTAFGMRPLLAERRGAAVTRPGRVALDELLRVADVVSVNCPLTEETRGMIGERELRLMKPTALVVDCSRGGVVDNTALAAAVKEGRIGGVGVDVLEEEPPVRGNPLLELRLPNVIVTPHVAWATQEAIQCLADQLIDCLEAFEKGEPFNVVGDTWPVEQSTG